MELCPVDGGRIESRIDGDRLIKTCMRCGLEERLDYVDPDGAAIRQMDELERGLLDGDEDDDADILNGDAVDDDPPADTAPMADLQLAAGRVVAGPRSRVAVAAQDWQDVAKARLTVLIDQINAAEAIKLEAEQICKALTVCGVELSEDARAWYLQHNGDSGAHWVN